jgi:high-affinity iron transporter
MITFRLQTRLPYKQMLVWNGALIGLVLVTMVGKTVHVVQAVSWLPISPIRGLTLPYGAGLWFGLFATWQGILAQIGSAVFVVGSYYLAEYVQHRHRQQLRQKTAVQSAIKPGKS